MHTSTVVEVCCRLSGLSPFYCESSTRDTLQRVREGKWTFDADAFAEISSEAKDLISKLLEKDAKCVGCVVSLRFSPLSVFVGDSQQLQCCDRATLLFVGSIVA